MGLFITPDSTVTKIEVQMDQCLTKLIFKATRNLGIHSSLFLFLLIHRLIYSFKNIWSNIFFIFLGIYLAHQIGGKWVGKIITTREPWSKFFRTLNHIQVGYGKSGNWAADGDKQGPGLLLYL